METAKCKNQKSSEKSELFAVWTGLELFAKIAYFSGPPRGSFFGGTELLTF
ncbi:hypothetical protein K1F50_03390 [Muricauda oceani]|nr:hypothetical protein [Allomuricauda oceani]